MDENQKPFNDVVDHMNRIEGNISNLAKADLKKMPKILRVFGYFMAGFFSISILLMIVLNLLK